MNCPALECNSPRTAVVDGLRPGTGPRWTRNALTRLRDSYPNSIARIRRCRDCGEEWYTIEVVVYPKDVPPPPPKVLCEHVMGVRTGPRAPRSAYTCTRTGLYVPSEDCRHSDPRCGKHQCKYCVDSRTAVAKVEASPGQGPGRPTGPGTFPKLFQLTDTY